MDFKKYATQIVIAVATTVTLTALGLQPKKGLADNNGCIQIGIINTCDPSHRPDVNSPKSIYFAEFKYGYWSVSVKGLQGETKRIFAFNSVDQFGDFWTPERRARAIADRMNKYISEKNYELVLGQLNSYHVVCTGVNGQCQNVIFTVKQGDEDLNLKVPALKAQINAKASLNPLYESACPQRINLILLAGTVEEQSKAVTPTCVSK